MVMAQNSLTNPVQLYVGVYPLHHYLSRTEELITDKMAG